MPVRAIAAAFAVSIACASMAGGYWLRGMRADRELVDLQRQHAAETSRRVNAALKASEEARAEEARRAYEMERIARDARTQVEMARRDAAAADDAAGRLRQHVARIAAQCAARGGAVNTAPAPGGSPASGAGLVLSDLFGGADAAAGDLAAAFDRARTAGLACERSYDALRPATMTPDSGPKTSTD